MKSSDKPTQNVEPEISLEEFNNLTLHEELMIGLEKLLPKWTVHIVDDYAPEYKDLGKSWAEVCKKVEKDKAKILIVSYLPLKFDSENDRYIGTIVNILVSKGYLLRRTSELIVCPKTGYALLSKKMYEYFKRHTAILPKEWKPECQSESDPNPDSAPELNETSQPNQSDESESLRLGDNSGGEVNPVTIDFGAESSGRLAECGSDRSKEDEESGRLSLDVVSSGSTSDVVP